MSQLELPPFDPPGNLQASVMQRLTEEGLIEPPVQPALVGRTVQRLESCGLIAPPSPWPGRLRAAAAVMLALGIGAAVGGRARRPEVRTVVRERIVPQEIVRRVEVPVVRVEVREKPIEVPVIKHTVEYRDRVVTKEVVRRVEVPRIKYVDRIKEQYRERVIYRDRPRIRIEVTDARHVERWVARRQCWEPVLQSSTLHPGTLLNCTGRGMLISPSQRYRFEKGVYLVTAAGMIDPLPEPEPRTRPLKSSTRGLIPKLLHKRRVGERWERTQAQEQLVRLWRRMGDPGLDRDTLIGMIAMRQLGAGATPPTTAEGWEAWARRVDSP